MCNLYSAGPAPHHDRSRWDRQVREYVESLAEQRVFPGRDGVVLRWVDEAPHADIMKWGFERSFAARPINNARDDKLDGGMWSRPFRERRCVIPVRWFVEWHQRERTPSGKKRILSLRAPDDGYLWMAGIWEEHEGRLFYSMITTGPNEQMAPIHDRMPTILAEEDIQPFLESEEAPRHLIAPYRGEMIIQELARSTDDPSERMLF